MLSGNEYPGHELAGVWQRWFTPGGAPPGHSQEIPEPALPAVCHPVFVTTGMVTASAGYNGTN